MIQRLLLRLVLLAVVIGLVTALMPGIELEGGAVWLVWIAFIFSVVNLILGPVFRLLGLPLIVVTLGLFLLIINAALLAITAGITDHLQIDGFVPAFVGALLITVFSWVGEFVLPLRSRAADLS